MASLLIFLAGTAATFALLFILNLIVATRRDRTAAALNARILGR